MLTPTIPAFIFIYVSLVLLRIIFDISFTKSEIIALSLSFLFGFGFILKTILYVDVYYYWYLSAVLFILNFRVFEEIYKNKGFIMISLFLLMFFSFFAFISIVNGADRFSFIFGPNVLYRIFGCLFLIVFQYKLNDKEFNSVRYVLLILLSFSLMAVGLFATGSRGATVVFIICFILMTYRLGGIFGRVKVMLTFLIPITFFVVLKFDSIVLTMGRLLYFDTSNSSEEYRLSKWKLINIILTNPSDSVVFYGLGRGNNIMESYPHNIILELISYYGLYGVGITLLFFLFCIYSLIKCESYRRLFLVLIPISFGSLVSGDLFDNVAVFGLLLIGMQVVLRESFSNSVKGIVKKF